VIRGKVYAQNSDRKTVLFTYERLLVTYPDRVTVQVRYFYPDGKIAYEENYLIKDKQNISYNYDQKQVGDKDSAVIAGSKLSLSFTEEEKTKTTETEDKGLLVLPVTISLAIQEHWDSLMSGKDLDTRFVAVERLETIGFTFRKKKEITHEGKEAVVIQMKPSSFIIASIVDPIMMIFEKGGQHRLLETNGRLPLRVSKYGDTKKRSDWKAMDAILALEYPNP